MAGGRGGWGGREEKGGEGGERRGALEVERRGGWEGRERSVGGREGEEGGEGGREERRVGREGEECWREGGGRGGFKLTTQVMFAYGCCTLAPHLSGDKSMCRLLTSKAKCLINCSWLSLQLCNGQINIYIP